MKFNSLKNLYLLLFLVFVIPANAKSPQESRNELAQLKITYSIDDFIKCAEEGKTDIIKLFLDAGMNPNAKDQWGETALISASYYGHLDIVQILLAKGADVNMKTKNISLLKDTNSNKNTNNGITALMNAAQEGYTDIAQVLIAKNADVNARDWNGTTILMYAAQNGNSDIVLNLLNKGARVNAKNDFGETALMYATRNGHVNIVRILLGRDADVNAKNKTGQTAMMQATTAEIEGLLKLVGAKE